MSFTMGSNSIPLFFRIRSLSSSGVGSRPSSGSASLSCRVFLFLETLPSAGRTEQCVHSISSILLLERSFDLGMICAASIVCVLRNCTFRESTLACVLLHNDTFQIRTSVSVQPQVQHKQLGRSYAWPSVARCAVRRGPASTAPESHLQLTGVTFVPKRYLRLSPGRGGDRLRG